MNVRVRSCSIFHGRTRTNTNVRSIHVRVRSSLGSIRFISRKSATAHSSPQTVLTVTTE